MFLNIPNPLVRLTIAVDPVEFLCWTRNNKRNNPFSFIIVL